MMGGLLKVESRGIWVVGGDEKERERCGVR